MMPSKLFFFYARARARTHINISQVISLWRFWWWLRVELEERKEKFDVIVGDLADPVEGGPCYKLYTKSFYNHILKPKLNDNGIFVTQVTLLNKVPYDISRDIPLLNNDVLNKIILILVTCRDSNIVRIYCQLISWHHAPMHTHIHDYSLTMCCVRACTRLFVCTCPCVQHGYDVLYIFNFKLS